MRLGGTKPCGKLPTPPLGLILGLSAFPGVPRGDVGLVGDTEGPVGICPLGAAECSMGQGHPVLGLEPGLGEALGSHRDRVVLGSSSSEPWLPVQAINPSVGRGGSVCHLCLAVTAECHQPTQRLAKHPQVPQGAGTVPGAVEPGTEIPSGMSPASHTLFGHGRGINLGTAFLPPTLLPFWLFFFKY